MKTVTLKSLTSHSRVRYGLLLKKNRQIMKYRIFFILLSFVFISSCALLKDSKISNTDFEELTKENYEKLNGIYTNYPDTSVGEFNDFPYGLPFSPVTLWEQLEKFPIYREDSLEMQCVEIEFLSQKKVLVKLIETDNLLDSKVIKGRFKKGYFYRRRYFLILPFVPLLFGYESERYRLGLDGTLLIVDYRLKNWWFAVVAGTSHNRTCNSKYKKITTHNNGY